MSIEYALAPVLGRATEELFGYWQVGSGAAEAEQVAEVMAHPDVARAVEIYRWAIGELGGQDSPNEATLASLSQCLSEGNRCE